MVSDEQSSKNIRNALDDLRQTTAESRGATGGWKVYFGWGVIIASIPLGIAGFYGAITRFDTNASLSSLLRFVYVAVLWVIAVYVGRRSMLHTARARVMAGMFAFVFGVIPVFPALLDPAALADNEYLVVVCIAAIVSVTGLVVMITGFRGMFAEMRALNKLLGLARKPKQIGVNRRDAND